MQLQLYRDPEFIRGRHLNCWGVCEGKSEVPMSHSSRKTSVPKSLSAAAHLGEQQTDSIAIGWVGVVTSIIPTLGRRLRQEDCFTG